MFFYWKHSWTNRQKVRHLGAKPRSYHNSRRLWALFSFSFSCSISITVFHGFFYQWKAVLKLIRFTWQALIKIAMLVQLRQCWAQTEIPTTLSVSPVIFGYVFIHGSIFSGAIFQTNVRLVSFIHDTELDFNSSYTRCITCPVYRQVCHLPGRKENLRTNPCAMHSIVELNNEKKNLL